MADLLPLSALSDSELEQRLIDLGPRLYPTTPDLATQVRHRLESESVGDTPHPPPQPLTRRRQERGLPGLPAFSLLPAPRGEGPGMRGVPGQQG